MGHYHRDGGSSDESAYEARLDAHNFLYDALPSLMRDTPVISGQTEESQWHLLPKAPRYWLVDPLDGTREFVNRTRDFTINIALIQNSHPVMGVVHAPATGDTYYATASEGAWCARGEGAASRIATRLANVSRLGVVASTEHLGPLVGAMLEHVPDETIRWMASSMKYCIVAEGQADICVRELPSLEWETAAAQCLVEVAGGLFCLLDGKGLSYGKPGFKNPPLVAVGDWQLDWQPLVFGNLEE
jgi:3'(2'), 5'-bisphosphate nucleotidase